MDWQSFTYWDSDDAGPITEHLAHWRAQFPLHAVVTRREARRLLEQRAPQHLEMFDRIAIPACRSDLARLLLLEAQGGLYVDAHCGIADAPGVQALINRLNDADLVLGTRYAPRFEKIMPYNGVLVARRGSPVLGQLIADALENLSAKFMAEQQSGFEPYHVWDISGPGVLWRRLFETDATDGRLKSEWSGRVDTVFETGHPVARHAFLSYRAPGAHWSERQVSERLFPAPECAGGADVR